MADVPDLPLPPVVGAVAPPVACAVPVPEPPVSGLPVLALLVLELVVLELVVLELVAAPPWAGALWPLLFEPPPLSLPAGAVLAPAPGLDPAPELAECRPRLREALDLPLPALSSWELESSAVPPLAD
ncbi:MAG TPA: hypothetical protein VFE65_13400 [Pseudonocardia sp.]|nr:hypothetical protein [Pseudonocardia sp.]